MIKIFFILNRKVTPQKNRRVGCWLLALPRAQMTRLSRILGLWFNYHVPVLINFMTPSKHLSIAYQGINFRHLLRFFFLSKAHHVWFIFRLTSLLTLRNICHSCIKECSRCLYRINSFSFPIMRPTGLCLCSKCLCGRSCRQHSQKAL